MFSEPMPRLVGPSKKKSTKKSVVKKKEKGKKDEIVHRQIEPIRRAIRIESVDSVLDQVSKYITEKDEITVKFMNELRDALRNNCVEIKNKATTVDLDELNKAFLDLCFARQKNVEKYQMVYVESVVNRIKNEALFKHVPQEVDYSKYTLDFDTCVQSSLLEKIEQAPSMLGSYKNVKELLADCKRNCSNNDMYNMTSYFKRL